VGINQAEPDTIAGILQGEVPEQSGLVGADLANDVKVRQAFTGRDRDVDLV
jgi:hypothetical protein